MRKSLELDHMLENAGAVALGLEKPHPQAQRKVRMARVKHMRGTSHAAGRSRREPVRVAA